MFYLYMNKMMNKSQKFKLNKLDFGLEIRKMFFFKLMKKVVIFVSILLVIIV